MPKRPVALAFVIGVCGVVGSGDAPCTVQLIAEPLGAVMTASEKPSLL